MPAIEPTNRYHLRLWKGVDHFATFAATEAKMRAMLAAMNDEVHWDDGVTIVDAVWNPETQKWE